jgi:hypothetical protein
MSDNKVIAFPKLKKSSPPQSLEEMAEKAAEYKRKYSEEFCEKLHHYVFGEMTRDGIDFENQEEVLFPNIVLVMESISALHLRANGIFHPLQEFADDAFEETITDEIRQDFVENLPDIEEED